MENTITDLLRPRFRPGIRLLTRCRCFGELSMHFTYFWFVWSISSELVSERNCHILFQSGFFCYRYLSERSLFKRFLPTEYFEEYKRLFPSNRINFASGLRQPAVSPVTSLC